MSESVWFLKGAVTVPAQIHLFRVDMGSKVGRVKSMTQKLYTCPYLAWRSALLGSGTKQWNEEDQSSVIEISPA